MHDVFNSPEFKEAISEIAIDQNIDLEEAMAEAKSYLIELHSVSQPVGNMAIVRFIKSLIVSGYDKSMDVSESELKRVAKLMRKHPVAFVMTHKTYIDMFVLGLALTQAGLQFPRIFAGANLNFTGFGDFAKQAGIIFIRRTFKNNPIYKTTLRHYIANLVNQKECFMWAIEGTRSRTGKLLWPKMGILKYIMEAEKEAKQQVKYIPVSIVYDLISDVKEMVAEGRGGEKKGEDFGWMVNYLRKLRKDSGRIAIRFGEPVDIDKRMTAPVPGQKNSNNESDTISNVAFEIVHRINQVSAVTTVSLVCVALLGKYAMTKKEIEQDVFQFIQLIENHGRNVLVDKENSIGWSIQNALNLLIKADICTIDGFGSLSQYTINTEQYLSANYYANMAIHHFYHRAFVEIALIKVASQASENRRVSFWEGIMNLRALFKFEFFYTSKSDFAEEIETELSYIDTDWRSTFFDSKTNINKVLSQLKMIIAPVVLINFVEAYLVVFKCLLKRDESQVFDEYKFTDFCIVEGEKMHWQGQVRLLESVAKPFLRNGIRMAKNLKLINKDGAIDGDSIQEQIVKLNNVMIALEQLNDILRESSSSEDIIPLQKQIPRNTEEYTQPVLDSEEGSHIGAFFDLDRTLISDFSVKSFIRSRAFSGKMLPREVAAQVQGLFLYATGRGSIAELATLSTQGMKGIKEQMMIELGEEVFLNHLSKSIYPEARALVKAHLAQNHTVAIISSATPYQVTPIARDLGISNVKCTQMEVKKGRFTGKILEPGCWGEGKVKAAEELSETYNIKLDKSYFYSDSMDDIELLESIGHPRPTNPDRELTKIAHEREWTILNFSKKDKKPGIKNIARTMFSLGSVLPASASGLVKAATSMSLQEGINQMVGTFGDLSTAMAGLDLAIINEEYLDERPAVFIMNHQSNVDMLIAMKLLRGNTVGVGKKEIQKMPLLGPMLTAAGVIFLDRKNRQKSIEALQPAVDALHNGKSLLIMPEGTRSYDYTLQGFKKGAFHIAMEAQVPIVPIVVYNSHDALPRGKNFVTPSVVLIKVLPPRNTSKWTKENMNTQIEDIRNQYLQELGQANIKIS